MKTGISLYFSSGMQKNREVIAKAVTNKTQYLFTSLHIPEEEGADYQENIQELLELCRKGKLNLIVDVGPETLNKLGVFSIDDLASMGIEYIRLDYGFTAEETVRLSEKFHVVFNASTITAEEISEWKHAGADFERFAACHNYYPKQYSGLSIEKVKQINLNLKMLGFTIMAFVPGDLIMRGPLYEGLPTVEEHRARKSDLILNMLELYTEGLCDIVMVGDVDISEQNWHALSCIAENYVELHADIQSEYDFVRTMIHHDRVDSSEWIFRSQESRSFNSVIQPEVERKVEHGSAAKWNESCREVGSIWISNQKYLRYMGELEIAKRLLPYDERLNWIGSVREEERIYLKMIKNGLGIRLVP